MGQFRDILDALGEALADLPNAEQVVARMNLEPNTPCIDIYPADPPEDDSVRGFNIPDGAYLVTVRARVGISDYDSGQDILIDWMDCASDDGVEALIEADQTLGGVASSVDVIDASGFVSFQDVNGHIERLGAKWTVRVIPAR